MKDDIAITQLDYGKRAKGIESEPANSEAPIPPAATAAMLAEMDAALADEIASKPRVGYARTARQGKPIERTGIHYIYEFTLDELWEPEDGTSLGVQISGPSTIRASVVTASGTRLRISTEADLPPNALEQITLIDDPTQLLERLREVLKSNTEGATQLGSKALARIPFTSAHRETLDEYPRFIPRASQKEAIRLSLGSEVAFIIGPPGTGKTSTLVAIAYTLVREGRSILIAAHTNIAVDKAIIGLADMCQSGNLPALQEGRIIRYGAPQLNAVKEHADIYPSQIVKRIAHELEGERVNLDSQRSQVDSHLRRITDHDALLASQWSGQRTELLARQSERRSELESLLAHERERVLEIDTELKRVTQANAHAAQHLEETRQELTRLVSWQSEAETARAQHLTLIAALTARLSAAQQMNSFGRLIRGINVNQAARQVADAKQMVWNDEQRLQDVAPKLAATHQRVAVAQRDWETLRTKQAELHAQRLIPPEIDARVTYLCLEVAKGDQQLADGDRMREIQSSAAAKEQASLQSAMEQLAQQIMELDEKLRDIERRLLDEAQVVATTLTSVYTNPVLRERRFDCVIMDEVSMAPLPAVYIAASRADASVVAIGDPRQLAPIATSEKPSVRKWLKRDLFATARVSLAEAQQVRGRSSLLRRQSRMHPHISVIPRNHVYSGLLEDDYIAQADGYEDVAPAPGKHLLLCDTSDAAPVTSKPGKGSRFNLYHALTALAIARQILGTLPDRTFDADSTFRIGIVTPYAPQARLIQRMVKADGLDRTIRVGTVHRFQGLELEAMIFDTVESPPIPSATGFIGGGNGSDGQRLVNVAVTRPQHKLVIIANANYIARTFEATDTLRLAVDEARKSAVIPSREVLVSLSDVLSSPQPMMDGGVHSNVETAIAPIALEALSDETFFDRFVSDIRAAKRKIVIMGPFVRDWRTSNVAAELAAKILDGVQVIVVASEDRDSSPVDTTARKSLEDSGVIFRTSSGMHEKLVFIDGNVVYMGSLNPLSHRGTTEFMARMVSDTFAQDIANTVNADVRADPVKWGDDMVISLKNIPASGGVCPKCGGKLWSRLGRYGPFYGCSNFKHGSSSSCDYSSDITDEVLSRVPSLTSIPCDKCEAGVMCPRAQRKDLWLECAAASPCGHRRKIVVKR